MKIVCLQKPRFLTPPPKFLRRGSENTPPPAERLSHSEFEKAVEEAAPYVQIAVLRHRFFTSSNAVATRVVGYLSLALVGAIDFSAIFLGALVAIYDFSWAYAKKKDSRDTPMPSFVRMIPNCTVDHLFLVDKIVAFLDEKKRLNLMSFRSLPPQKAAHLNRLSIHLENVFLRIRGFFDEKVFRGKASREEIHAIQSEIESNLDRARDEFPAN